MGWSSNTPTGSRSSLESYDVIIIGSGIGGSTLALMLKSQGLSVCLVDKAQHPRFALGEAGVKETSLAFALLGQRYGVPELIHLSSAGRVRRHIGGASGQKQSFTFLWHGRGLGLDPEHSNQVGTLSFPFGTDTHYNRAEVDAYLAKAARSRGVPLYEGINVASITPHSQGVDLTLGDGRRLKARLLVDGPGLTHGPQGPLSPSGVTSLKTHSYALFTHMEGLKPAEDAIPQLRQSGLPQAPSRGTTHHLFEGGWIWVIPFNNLPGGTSPRTSVGLCLDPRLHPPQDTPPEATFREVTSAFPSIEAHLGGGRPAFPFRQSQRLQRFNPPLPCPWVVRPPHGVGFVDPLFSRGLYLTARGLLCLGEGILKALGYGVPFEEAMAPYAAWSAESLRVTDDLIHQAYRSFSSHGLFNAWHRLWGLGVYLESVRMAKHLLGDLAGHPPSSPHGPGLPLDIPEYRALFNDFTALMAQPSPDPKGLLQTLLAAPILPPSLNYSDPTQRWLKARTLPQQARIRRWALSPGGPERLTRLFRYPLVGVPKAMGWRWA